MIKAYKLYTGPDGNSYVQTGNVLNSILYKTGNIRFEETLAHKGLDWHNAPTTQYVLTLTGTLQFETQQGQKFIVKPGDVLIACDTTGTGHRWQLLNDEPWTRAYVTFSNEEEINFIPDDDVTLTPFNELV